MDTIANRLRQAMDIRNMKQSDIIDRTGINKGALSSYLSGRYKPKQDNIFLLAKALNVNEAWLMGADVKMDTATALDIDQEDDLDTEIMDIIKSLPEEEKKSAIDYLKFLMGKK